LKELREYHKRFPSTDITEAEDEGALLKAYDAPVSFTGEEMGGRCLDLHGLFQTFVNAKFGRKTDYVSFITGLTDFEATPRHHRLGRPYRWTPLSPGA
jgi:splicing factor 3A subunit 3